MERQTQRGKVYIISIHSIFNSWQTTDVSMEIGSSPSITNYQNLYKINATTINYKLNVEI